MKLINLHNGNVLLDDIDVVIKFDKEHTKITEIDDSLVRKSRCLTTALKHNMLKEVSENKVLKKSHQLAATNKITSTKEIDSKPTEQESRFASLDVVAKKPREDVKKLSRNVKEEKKQLDSFMTVHPEIHRAKYSSLDKYKNEGIMDVEYAGPMLDAGGFANMNRQYVFGLDKDGVNIRPQILPSIPDIDFDIGKRIGAMTKREVGSGCPKIYGMTAPSGVGWSGPKIFYTMMETYTLHPDYVDRCSMADEIWVPSQWNVDIFKKSGIRVPIHKMPLGVDVDSYKPGLKPLSMSESLGGDFVFLSLFGWSYRKGYDVLLKAFLSEFTKDDDATLLISSRYFGSTDDVKKKKIRDDVNAIKASIDNPNMPRVVLFGDVMPDAMLPRLYNSADCFVLISRGEGFGLPCHPAETMVNTINGQKYISEIKKGDIVYSHTGEKRKVEYPTSRHYNGYMYEFTMRGSNISLKATEKHPLFIAKRNKRRYAQIRNTKMDPSWIAAKDVEKHDFIAVPKLKFSSSIKKISISDYVDNLDFDKNKVYLKQSYKTGGEHSYATIAQATNEPVSYIYKALNTIKTPTDRAVAVKEYATSVGYEKPKPISCDNEIHLTDEVMEFFGLYLAEGWQERNMTINLASHAKEHNVRELECKVVKKLFGNVVVNEWVKANRGNVSASSSMAAKLMSSLFGDGALNKDIPKFMYGNNNIGALIRGLFKGDAHLKSGSLSTSSASMAESVRLILNANGIYAYKHKTIREGRKNPEYSVSIAKCDAKKFFEFTKLKTHNYPNNKTSRADRQDVFSDKNYFYIPIVDAKKRIYDGMVYNMHVEVDNSYMAEGYSSHNCAEAGACEIPVISSNYSGHTEFLNKDNSYLVDVDQYVVSDSRLSWISHFYEGQKFPLFGDPAVQQTREYMRRVYENKKEAKKKAKKLRKNLVENYTWTKCVDRVESRLTEIYEEKTNGK